MTLGGKKGILTSQIPSGLGQGHPLGVGVNTFTLPGSCVS